jgi:acyl-CoA synthetase (AMP-forming)/AMP-acid ligase II
VSGIGSYARATPDAAALISMRGAITFARLHERQAAFVGFLRGGEVSAGDRIAVYSGNRPELLEVTIGALRAGIVPVPIHSMLTGPEATYIVEDSGARWLFTDRPVDAHPQLERIVTFGDAYERCLHEARPTEIASVALGRPMHYTSGTTGRVKGVWVAPLSERAALESSTRFRDLWGFSSSDVHLVCSPLTHSAPHRFSLRTLESGGSVVVQTKFDAEESLAAIELFGVTTTFMVPTHLERILALNDRVLARHDLSSLRLLAHAGAPIRPETKQRAIDLFPHGSVWEFYGSTEGQATRISTEEWIHKTGSVGRALPGAEIFVTDEDGNVLPSNEVGEVWVRDPRAERFEYWGDKAKTRSAWRAGAFSVADLGWLDEDGYLFLTGRKHDTIISGGVNVYPQEVERVLSSHPAVAEAMVYGADHPEWGQEVRAAIVAAFGQPLDVEKLTQWLKERLAGYKVPRKIQLVEDLPRTPTGKLKRGPLDSEEQLG